MPLQRTSVPWYGSWVVPADTHSAPPGPPTASTWPESHPPRHLGEFYGLYATVGRFATLLGPLSWGLIVNVFHLSRSVAMGALLAFLVAARVVLGLVDDEPRTWGPEDLVPAVPRSGGNTFGKEPAGQ